MKRVLILMLVCLLVLGLGCGSKVSKPDEPILTSDEACALVYNYLQTKAAAMIRPGLRLQVLSALDKARPSFEATYNVYISNGEWYVLALGYDGASFCYGWDGGIWRLYETSRVIEPVDDKAQALLLYITRFS